MKSKMKGVTEYSFLIWYSFFVLAVVYISGLAGYQILQGVPEPPTTVEAPSLLNVLQPFQVFIALMTVNTTYQLLGSMLFAPLAIVVFYLIIKALPFT